MAKKEREGKLDQMKEGRDTKRQTIRGREKRKRKESLELSFLRKNAKREEEQKRGNDKDRRL